MFVFFFYRIYSCDYSNYIYLFITEHFDAPYRGSADDTEFTSAA